MRRHRFDYWCTTYPIWTRHYPIADWSTVIPCDDWLAGDFSAAHDAGASRKTKLKSLDTKEGDVCTVHAVKTAAIVRPIFSQTVWTRQLVTGRHARNYKGKLTRAPLGGGILPNTPPDFLQSSNIVTDIEAKLSVGTSPASIWHLLSKFMERSLLFLENGVLGTSCPTILGR